MQKFCMWWTDTERTTKALISLRECADWYSHLLLACNKVRFSRVWEGGGNIASSSLICGYANRRNIQSLLDLCCLHTKHIDLDLHTGRNLGGKVSLDDCKFILRDDYLYAIGHVK